MASKRINRGACVVLSAIAFALSVSAGWATSKTDLAHLHAGDSSKTPIGWLQFCTDRPAECSASDKNARRLALTDARWSELNDVNLHFNRAIEPITDQDQFGVVERWTYADTGKGDCEDYVLEKRRELIRRGWPLSQLLITVVLDKQNSGHAVLTVATDRGEFVLDNQEDRILPWSKTGLTFIKRQSPQNLNEWVDLGRMLGRPDVVTASTSR